ncbi:MAG: FGGY family carbohydrate kinase, partial [Cyclobacteriaceae bacterium]
MKNEQKLVIGLDYGTDSVRAVLVDSHDGLELADSVFSYPRWKQGLYNDPAKSQFRQHPFDYLEGLEKTILDILSKAQADAANRVVAISVDTTGSTPVPVDRNGTPLALLPDFAENPNAMFILWKDHTALQEANEINRLCRSWQGVDYTKYEGGIYSSEWFWAKILHVLRNDESVSKQAFSWVEHCDWIPALLTGNTDPLQLKRSRCAAGHKAMWHPEWGGLPSDEFLQQLDVKLKGLRENLYDETFTSDVAAGNLSR